MDATHISITEAKQKLGELVKRVNYGGERFVLEFRDKPQAVLMSCEELEKLSPSVDAMEERRRRGMATLEKLDKLRARIRARTNVKFDSVRDIRKVRDEDLKRLERADGTPEHQLELLGRLRLLRERIAARGGTFDSARELREVRNERADHLSDLR